MVVRLKLEHVGAMTQSEEITSCFGLQRPRRLVYFIDWLQAGDKQPSQRNMDRAPKKQPSVSPEFPFRPSTKPIPHTLPSAASLFQENSPSAFTSPRPPRIDPPGLYTAPEPMMHAARNLFAIPQAQAETQARMRQLGPDELAALDCLASAFHPACTSASAVPYDYVGMSGDPMMYTTASNDPSSSEEPFSSNYPFSPSSSPERSPRKPAFASELTLAYETSDAESANAEPESTDDPQSDSFLISPRSPSDKRAPSPEPIPSPGSMTPFESENDRSETTSGAVVEALLGVVPEENVANPEEVEKVVAPVVVELENLEIAPEFADTTEASAVFAETYQSIPEKPDVVMAQISGLSLGKSGETMVPSVQQMDVSGENPSNSGHQLNTGIQLDKVDEPADLSVEQIERFLAETYVDTSSEANKSDWTAVAGVIEAAVLEVPVEIVAKGVEMAVEAMAVNFGVPAKLIEELRTEMTLIKEDMAMDVQVEKIHGQASVVQPEERDLNLAEIPPAVAVPEDLFSAGASQEDMDVAEIETDVPSATSSQAQLEEIPLNERTTRASAEKSASKPAPAPVEPSSSESRKKVSSFWGEYLAKRLDRIFLSRLNAQGIGNYGENGLLDHYYGDEMDNGGTSGKGFKVMFQTKNATSGVPIPLGGDDEDDEYVDVVYEVAPIKSPLLEPPMVCSPFTVPYDYRRASRVMRAMERCLVKSRLKKDSLVEVPVGGIGVGGGKGLGKVEDDPMIKTRGTWSNNQKAFFDRCMKVIYQEKHMRMACSNDAEEAIIRRLSLDRSSSRFRRLMAGIQWNGRMVYWLHATFIDGLPPLMLSIYFEILQTLRPKIPELVNSLLNYMLPTSGDPNCTNEELQRLLEEPWDPVGKSVFRFSPPIKLPNDPLFIIAPHTYAETKGKDTAKEAMSFVRIRGIVRFLGQFGPVVQVQTEAEPKTHTAKELYKNMLVNMRNTIVEMAGLHTERALVLVGLGIGSMVACQASLLEACSNFCSAIICFGFPLRTPRGMHGDFGDPLLKLVSAVQFHLGIDALNCPIADFMDFRTKLECETDVVFAAGCDDYLRMKYCHKMRLRMTQSMVDRALLEHCVQFLQNALPKAEHRRAAARARIEPAIVDVAPKKRKNKPATATPRNSPAKKSKTTVSPEIPYKANSARKIDFSTTESNSSPSSTSQSQDSSNHTTSTPSTVPQSPVEPPKPPTPAPTPNPSPPSPLPSINLLSRHPLNPNPLLPPVSSIAPPNFTPYPTRMPPGGPFITHQPALRMPPQNWYPVGPDGFPLRMPPQGQYPWRHQSVIAHTRGAGPMPMSSTVTSFHSGMSEPVAVFSGAGGVRYHSVLRNTTPPRGMMGPVGEAPRMMNVPQPRASVLMPMPPVAESQPPSSHQT